MKFAYACGLPLNDRESISVATITPSPVELDTAMIDQESLFNLAAFFADFGFDAVHIIAHVYAISDGSFVVIFGNAVLLKVGNGLRRRRCCQPSEEAVEVFEHLPPQVVNGTMAFIGNDEVEHLDRHFAVVRPGWLDRPETESGELWRV